MRKITRMMRVTTLAIAILLSKTYLMATSYTWTGTVGTDMYTPGNWNPNTGPPGTSDTATFSGSPSNFTPGLSTGEIFHISQMIFPDNPSTQYTVSSNASGAAIDFDGSGILNSSTGTPSFLLGNGGQINFNNSSTVSNTSSGTVTFTWGTGSGTLNFNDSSSAGSAIIQAQNTSSSVNFSSTSTAGNANITMNAGTSLNFSGTASAGSATMSITGAAATANFSGGATGSNTATMALTSGGALNLNTSIALGTLTSDSSSPTNLSSNNLTINSGTLAGTVNGTGGSLTIQGPGTTTMSNTNTYTGATNILGGILNILNLSSISSSSGVGISSGATFKFGPLTGSTTYNGPTISGAGTVEVDLGGANSMTLANANSYTGPTKVTSGVLNVTNALAVSSSSSINLVAGSPNPSTINFNTAGSYNNPITGLGLVEVSPGVGNTFILGGANTYQGGTIIGPGTLQTTTTSLPAGTVSNPVDILSTGILDFEQTTGTGTYSGVITGPGKLQINSNTGSVGTVTLTGNNSYTGQTIIGGGTLSVTNLSSISNDINVTSLGGNPPGTIDFNVSGGGTYGGTITGSGNVTVEAGNGASALILTGLTGSSTNYTGTTTVNTGTLKIDNLAGTTNVSTSLITLNNSSTIVFNQAAGTFGFTSAQITGSGGVVINADSLPGFGTFIFSNNSSTSPNDYTGGTVVNDGTLIVTSVYSLPANGLVTLNQPTALLEFSPTSNGTYTGTITGAGGINLNGGAGVHQ